MVACVSGAVAPLAVLHRQARLEDEKQRLAAQRVLDDHPLALAAVEATGQRVGRSTTLEEMLRRPHLRYGCENIGSLSVVLKSSLT